MDKDQNKLPITIEDLPEEVLEFILGMLPPYKDLQNCKSVNRRWYICSHNVMHKTKSKLIKAIGEFNILWENITANDLPTITKRFSHAACVHENSMYIFGGCTTNSTSFNDLWRFDLSRRLWIRPLATGTYPVPKAYSSMVPYKDDLIIFGGWTFPSFSQHYQNITLFNEIHFYCVRSNKWSLVNTTNSPPPMAGHSACMVGCEMIVFGGLVVSDTHNYEIQCSNELWVLNVLTCNWRKQPTTKPRPSPRYAQSLICLDSERLMILGGLQTRHYRFVYSDCWLLTMKGPTWTWKELTVRNKEWASANIWCNPACKVGDKVVSLSRSRSAWNSAKPYVTSAVRLSPLRRPQGAPVSVRVEQSLQRPLDRDLNVNGRRGALPRQNHANLIRQQRPQVSEEPLAGPSNELSVRPKFHSNSNENSNIIVDKLNNSKSDLVTRFGKDKNRGVKIAKQLKEANKYRMAAFSCETESDSPINNPIDQREIVNREENANDLNVQQRQPTEKKTKRSTLTMHVMDISSILSDNSYQYVSWLCPRLGEMSGAPEELVLYSLVKGNGELIMFGGVHNDICIINRSEQHNLYSNSLHFLVPPKDVI